MTGCKIPWQLLYQYPGAWHGGWCWKKVIPLLKKSAVIEGVAEKVPQRLRRLINLDGNFISDGHSFNDAINPKFTVELRRIVAEEGEGWFIPFSERTRILMGEKDAIFGVTDLEDLRWLKKHLTPHPFATFEQKLFLTRTDSAAIPRTFMWCSIFDGKKLEKRPVLPPKWDLIEIETGHDAMISAPGELSEILEKLAK